MFESVSVKYGKVLGYFKKLRWAAKPKEKTQRFRLGLVLCTADENSRCV